MQRLNTDNQGTFYLLFNRDVYFYIIRYLNPIDLFFWAITSKFFLKFITDKSYNHFWLHQLQANFPVEGPEIGGGLINSLSISTDHLKETLYYDIFKQACLTHYETLAQINMLEFIRGKTFFTFFQKKEYKSVQPYFAKQIYKNNTEDNIDNLIYSSIKFNQADNFFKQLLFIKLKKISARNHISIAKLTVDNIVIRDHSILHLAIKLGSVNILKCLLTLGAQADPPTNDAIESHASPLSASTAQKNNQMVSLLLLHIPFGAKCLNRALYIASRQGSMSIVKLFVLHGAKINTEFNPLFFAMQNGHAEIVHYLLEKGASGSLEYNSVTPLYAAAENDHLIAIQTFINYHQQNQIKLNIDKKSKSFTALFIAAKKGNAKVCELLLNHGANVNEICYGFSPLFVAIQKDRLEVAQVLCSAKYNLNINFINSYGWTALHCAIERACFGIINLLIQKGVDVNKPDSQNISPLHYASLIQSYPLAFSIISLLIRGGANPLMRSTEMKKKLSSCTINPNIKTIFLLLEDIAKFGLNDFTATPSKYTLDTKLLDDDIAHYINKNKLGKGKFRQSLAETCQNLLLRLFTPFGYAVVLYALLLQENKNIAAKKSIFGSEPPTQAEEFIQYIVNKLGFSSKPNAENALLDIIKTNLSAQQLGPGLFNKLLGTIIVEIVEILKKPNEWQDISINKIILCLNFFEVKVKQSIELLLQEEPTKILKLS